MNRQDFFLMCLQTLVLKRPLSGTMAIAILGEAADLPEEALGTTNVPVAALAFVDWWEHKLTTPKEKLNAKLMPDWLAAYEEGVANRVRLRVAPHEQALQWWYHAEEAVADSLEGRGLPIPKVCFGLLVDGPGAVDEVVVGRQAAAQFMAFVESVPGHEQQPFEQLAP